MKAIIPAAGYATRLYPLTLDRPKALLDVKGEPIINHIIRKIEEIKEVGQIYIVTNAKFFPEFEKWLTTFEQNIPIRLLNDNTTSNEDRLGQMGDIQLVIDEEKIDDDLLVIAGDNLFNFSLIPIYNFFREKGKCVNALYDIKSVKSAQHLGVVSTDSEGKIILFEEKPEKPKSTNVSLGIYFFPKDRVSLIKKYIDEGNNPDKIGYFWIWAIKTEDVYGHVYKEKWFDIGWQESLEQARKEFTG